MAADRTVSVVLQARVDSFVGGMKKAEAATKTLTQQTKKAQTEQELLGKAARLVGGIAVVALGKQFVDAASNMNETVSKSNVVFGKSAAAVTAWAQGSARAMGMSQQAAIESAATFGNLFVSMGLGSASSEKMSTSLVQLAGDLASFNNVDPAVALDALRSGLVGETEPLRKFGVNLNDADLRQKALAMGLVKSTKEVLPPAIKTQAAYALILEQTKTAQGDYARTADGLANSQRTLSAEWADAQAKLGQDLLPAVNSTVHGLNSMLEVVNGAPAPVRNAGLAIGALGAALLLMAPRLIAAKEAFALLPASAQASAKGIAAVIGKMTLIAGAAALATKAITDFRDESVNGGLSTDALTTKLADTNTSLGDLGFTLSAITSGTHDFNDALKVAADPGISNNIESFIAGFAGAPSTLSQATASVQQVDQALADLAGNGHLVVAQRRFLEFRASYIAAGGSGDEFDRVMTNSKAAIDAAGKSTAATGAAAVVAAAQVKTFGQTLADLNAPAADVTKSQIAVIDAAKTLAEGMRKSKDSFSLSTQAGRDNLNNLISLTDGINAYGAAVEKKTGSTDKARDAVLKERDALVLSLTATGLAKDKAKALVDQYLKIPAAKSTVVTAPGLDAVNSTVWSIASGLDAISQHKSVVIGVTNKVRAAGGKLLAAGGPVTGPGSGTSDDVPAWLSNGEFVMTASAVDTYGPEFFTHLNANAYAGGGLVGIGFSGGKKAAKKKTTAKKKVTHPAAHATGPSLADQIAADLDTLNFNHDMGRTSDAQLATQLSTLLHHRGITLSQSRSIQLQIKGLRDGIAAAAKQARDDAAQAAAGSSQSFGVFGGGSIIGSFDFGQTASATQGLADAQKNQADAQSALDSARTQTAGARSYTEYVAGIEAQAKAEQDLADAKKAVAAADAAKTAAEPTGAKVVAGFKDKAAKLATFSTNLGILAKRGLSPVILREILDAGIGDGSDMAAVLVRDGFGDLNSIQAGINSSSANLATWGAMLPDSLGSITTTGSTGAGSAPTAATVVYNVAVTAPQGFAVGTSMEIAKTITTILQTASAQGLKLA